MGLACLRFSSTVIVNRFVNSLDQPVYTVPFSRFGESRPSITKSTRQVDKAA